MTHVTPEWGTEEELQSVYIQNQCLALWEQVYQYLRPLLCILYMRIAECLRIPVGFRCWTLIYTLHHTIVHVIKTTVFCNTFKEKKPSGIRKDSAACLPCLYFEAQSMPLPLRTLFLHKAILTTFHLQIKYCVILDLTKLWGSLNCFYLCSF